MISNTTNEVNFLHKSVLTNGKIESFCKTFTYDLSANMKLSKKHFSKKIHVGEFPGTNIGTLMKAGLPLIKNIIKPLAKSLPVPLRLTAAAPPPDASFLQIILVSRTTPLTISNKEKEDIKKIIRYFEEFDLLIHWYWLLILIHVSKRIKNETSEEKGGFLGTLLCRLDISLLVIVLTRKGVIKTGEGVIQAGERTINKRAVQDF